VIASGSLAYANARVRALKSGLLGREVAARVVAGLPAARELASTVETSRRELLRWYGIVLASYPRGQQLFLSLLRRHEIENIKVAWRAIVNAHAAGRWVPHWIELGPLASVRLEAVRDCRTLPSLVEALRRTPFDAIATAMWRAHAHDPLAAEIGFDRWASRAIVESARALPEADHLAAALALVTVRERDFAVVRRANAAGLAPEILTGALGCLHDEIDPREVMRLAAWTPAEGTFWPAVPRQFRRHAAAAADWDRWLLWWRGRRRALCRRAFRESPFCLAPAVALLLLKEEEILGLDALATFEAGGRGAPSLEYALAAGELG
jgi:hypothetical protein